MRYVFALQRNKMEMEFNTAKIEEIKGIEFEKLREREAIMGNEKGEMILIGERFNVMGSDYFMADFLKILQKLAGPASGGILYNSGVELGKLYYGKFNEGTNDEILGKTLGFLKFCGYSDIRFSEDGTMVVENSPTAVAFKIKYTDRIKTCYYLAGILCGILSSVLDKRISIIETKCIAKGDICCEFKVKD